MERTITVVRGKAAEAVTVLGLPAGEVKVSDVLEASGFEELYTQGGARVDDDGLLDRLLGEKGCKLVVRRADAAAVNTQLSETVARLRDEKLALFEQLKQHEREAAQLRARVAELEGLGSTACAEVRHSGAPLAACSSKAPQVEQGLRFDPKLSGDALEFSDGDRQVVSTHSYNKMAFTVDTFDASGSHYAEFHLTRPFSKYTCVGVCLENGMDQVNPNTDALGEHPFSYAWGSHTYWSACFNHNGASSGPKGGEWRPGSRVGVLVQNGAVSFYLDGHLRHQHVFRGLQGAFRFGISFGGPKATPEGDFGTAVLVQRDADEWRAA